MATSLYKEEEADLRLKGDYLDVDGTLNVDGAATFGSTLQVTGGLTIAAPSGTDAGLAWTTGAPAFSDGQKYITLTAGSTTYRVPVWLNA